MTASAVSRLAAVAAGPAFELRLGFSLRLSVGCACLLVPAICSAQTLSEPHGRDAGAAGGPPRPVGDFAVHGEVRPRGEARIAYRQGRMRVEISEGGMTMIVGIVDAGTRKLVVMPSIVGAPALEIDLPPELAFTAMPADAKHIGSDVVATEPCEVWRGLETSRSAPVESCITPDGIPLRAHTVTASGARVSFEATELERTSQDPKHFEPPAGTKVRRVPSSLQGMVPSLMP